MPPVNPKYFTESLEKLLASKVHNIPLYKYFIPKIQDYNDSNI